MTKNTLVDLNNHLFEQMERLNDEMLTEDELKREVERSRAMSGLAKNIISNSSLIVSTVTTRGSMDASKAAGLLPERSKTDGS